MSVLTEGSTVMIQARKKSPNLAVAFFDSESAEVWG